MTKSTLPYPPNWADISYQVRQAAGWKCEHCGRDCQQLGENMLNFAKRILHTEQPEIGFVRMSNIGEVISTPGKWVLQACHVDQDPSNNDPSNLRAWCASCHRAHDNQVGAVEKRYHLSLETHGQYNLFEPAAVAVGSPAAALSE